MRLQQTAFCPDCGKRNGPEPSIHTCTPPTSDAEATLRSLRQSSGTGPVMVAWETSDGVTVFSPMTRQQMVRVLEGAAEAKALRPDALRYLLLRDLNWNDSALCVVVNPKQAVKLGSDCPSHWRLDNLLDDLLAQCAQPARQDAVAELRAQVRRAVLTGVDDFRRLYDAELLAVVGASSFQDLCE